MKLTLIATLVFSFFFALLSCHKKAVPVISSRTEFPAAPASTSKPVAENTPEAIAAGKIIFETRCNRCHELKETRGYTTSRWISILKSMIPKARLNDEQAKQVTSYIMASAK